MVQECIDPSDTTPDQTIIQVVWKVTKSICGIQQQIAATKMIKTASSLSLHGAPSMSAIVLQPTARQTPLLTSKSATTVEPMPTRSNLAPLIPNCVAALLIHARMITTR